MSHVADHARHGGRGFLAGLHQEVLSIALAVLGHGADGFDRSGIERVGGIFGDEAAVGLHLRNAEQLGEVGDLAQGVDAGSAGFGRHQADGGRAVREVPFQRGRADYLNRGGNELVLCKQVAELGSRAGVKPPMYPSRERKQLEKPRSCTRRKVSSGRVEGADDQAECHRLEWARRRDCCHCGI